MGGCQNYGPFLGPYYNTGPNTGPNSGDPKRDHNFDNPPYIYKKVKSVSGHSWEKAASEVLKAQHPLAQLHVRANYSKGFGTPVENIISAKY